jgi:hypothetical protein
MPPPAHADRTLAASTQTGVFSTVCARQLLDRRLNRCHSLGEAFHRACGARRPGDACPTEDNACFPVQIPRRLLHFDCRGRNPDAGSRRRRCAAWEGDRRRWSRGRSPQRPERIRSGPMGVCTWQRKSQLELKPMPAD